MVIYSNAEVKYRFIAYIVCELLWLKLLLFELGFPIKEPMRLYYYNKEAISIAHNLIQHDRTKNFEMDHHFIKEELMSDQICIRFVKIGE